MNVVNNISMKQHKEFFSFSNKKDYNENCISRLNKTKECCKHVFPSLSNASYSIWLNTQTENHYGDILKLLPSLYTSPRRLMLDTTWSKVFPATSMPLTSRISSLTPSSPVLSASPPRTKRDINTPGTYSRNRRKKEKENIQM